MGLRKNSAAAISRRGSFLAFRTEAHDMGARQICIAACKTRTCNHRVRANRISFADLVHILAHIRIADGPGSRIDAQTYRETPYSMKY